MENTTNNTKTNDARNRENAPDEDAAMKRTSNVYARIRRAQLEAPQAIAQLKQQQQPPVKSPTRNPRTKRNMKTETSQLPSQRPARTLLKAVGSNDKIAMKAKKLTRSLEEGEDENLRNLVWGKFVEQCVCIETAVTLNSYFLTQLLNMSPPVRSYEAFNRNKLKNRSSDVFCLDQSRFILPDVSNDYIHANVVRFDRLPQRTYIVTQHPMESTLNDFWRMVAEAKTDVIVSLTNATSSDFPVYYPNKPETFLNFGAFFVYCKKVQAPKDKNEPIEYTLDLLLTTETFRTISLFHYPHWNKNQVPASTRVVLYIVKTLAKRKSLAPVVVQCETGVNQSAEVILVDVVCNMLLRSMEPQLEQVFRQLRSQRASAMTQRLQFLHSIACILDFIKANRRNMPPTELANIDSVMASISKNIAKNVSVEPPIPEPIL